MNRAFLALVQQRLKELEKAQLAQATARSQGMANYRRSTVKQARANLVNALRTWQECVAEEMPQTATIKMGKVDA